MNTGEVAYRIRQGFSLVSMRAQYALRLGLSQRKPTGRRYRFCEGVQQQLPPLPLDQKALRRVARSAVQSEISVAGRPWRWENSDNIWHCAPDTGREWPRIFFGHIDYREGNSFGDVRQVWEPSRLQHLLNFALLARERGTTSKAAVLVDTQLQSWVRENPALEGPHYISAMECALRLISVCHACDILRNEFKDLTPWRAIASIVESHAPLIERRLSVHSSAGNHTVAEAAGLVYAGLLFPEMARAARWTNRGLDLLRETSATQILPDGGGAEQAVWYHRFNIQLLWLARSLLLHFGRPVCVEITDAIDRGSRFLCEMGLDIGWVPPIGDSDDGYALSRFLQVPETNGQSPAVQTFAHSGYTVARVADTNNARLIFDHGPLGMAPAYGHAHADALNVLVRIGSHDLFIDPGTYTYTGDQRWRQYFRSTTAHNTVTVAKKDQARQEACFMWSQPFSTRLLAADTDRPSHGRLLADHDGYRGIGVRHVRGVAWNRKWLFVWDRLEGSGEYLLDLHWHLGGEPTLQKSDIVHVALIDGSLVTVECDGGTLSMHRGEETPILGWRSREYGSREAATTLRLRHNGPLPHTFCTYVRFPGGHGSQYGIQDALEWMTSRVQ